MKFPYKKHNGTWRPVIPVVISYGNKSVKYEVLIDSGSDKCFFDAEIGDAIGVLGGGGKIQEVFGIGGIPSSYYSHPVNITVGKESYTTDAGFMPSVGGGMVSYGFVGHKGFFDKFIVMFDFPNKEVILTQAKK